MQEWNYIACPAIGTRVQVVLTDAQWVYLLENQTNNSADRCTCSGMHTNILRRCGMVNTTIYLNYKEIQSFVFSAYFQSEKCFSIQSGEILVQAML